MAPIPSTMRAVKIPKHGGVEVLEPGSNYPVPTLKEGEVLVRNRFAGVNFIDTYFRGGLYAVPGFPYCLGREAAGEVVAVKDPASAPAGVKEGVRVVYMGVTCAKLIADKLMMDGVAPDMPVAVLERGTLPGSRAMRTLLADLGGLVERENVVSPAIIVVGEVVLLSDAENRLKAFAVQAESMA